MLVSAFLALFLPCAGMSFIFLIYICMLCFAATRSQNQASLQAWSGKETQQKGLSATELEKIPKVTGNDLVVGNECAVCLDEIEGDQPARLVPGCNHGFHLQCADAWLSRNAICPLCRATLQSELFAPPENNPC